jgi:hypothetical protein
MYKFNLTPASATKMTAAAETNSGKITVALEILHSDPSSNIYIPLPL